MNSLGMLSAYSAYTGTANSVYGAAPTSAVKDKQESSDAQKAYPGEINDEAIVSDEAKNLLAAEKSDTQTNLSNSDEAKTGESEQAKENESGFEKELTAEDKQTIAKLKARDMEVKAHEQAHMAAGSGINVSAPSYSYQTGPNGQRYAVGGEVGISFSSSADPADNIAKAQAMKAAALAPAQPSSQDMSVAQSADKMIAQYRKELSEQKAEELKAQDESTGNPDETNDSSSPQTSNEIEATTPEANQSSISTATKVKPH